MSFFYLRADFFGDQTSFSDSIFLSNSSLTVSSDNFNDPSFVEGQARSYIFNLNLGGYSNAVGNSGSNGRGSSDLDDGGSAFNIANLYISSRYKSGQIECVSANATSTMSNVEQISKFLPPRLFLVGSDNTIAYNVDVYESDGIILNKAYHKMLPAGDGSYATSCSINMTQDEITKVPVNNIYINYSACRVLNFKIYPTGAQTGTLYRSLILIEDKKLDYIEDFSDKFYYDLSTQRYYLDAMLTKASLKVYDYFFPYLLLSTPDGWITKSVFHGAVKLQLESKNDSSLDNVSAELNYPYADICQSSTIVAPNNTILCTSNAGEVSINVGGVITIFDDQQICPIGGTPKTVIAVFSLKPLEKLTLYKNFSSITTVKSDIWGYNFRYIKYYDGTNYYAFKDYGSLASATISYLDQTLDLSKYFSVKEVSDGLTLTDSGKIVAITMGFKIFKITEADADATNYFIDVPVEILSPSIISIDEDIEAKQIIIKTNYATRLTYGFNEETASSISVTDTADGTNQITTISSNGKFGHFYCRAFNYYYDFGGLVRELYSSDENTLDLIRTITIPTFTLTVKIGGVTKTIYDEAGNSSSSLPFTDLSQDQIANYFVYSDYYTNTGSYSFLLSYSFAGTAYSKMFLRLGNDPTLHAMVLSGGIATYTISKSDLFESLDNQNKITLSFLADGEVPFSFPFTFLNTSQSNAPVCNAFSLSRVQISYPRASIGFTLSYTYADEVQYSVIDQDGNSLYEILIKERFRDIESYFLLGTTRQRGIQINDLNIPETATSLRVSATVRNIYSATNPIKIEDTKISSPAYYLPLKIGDSEVVLFSDSALTNEITEITKGQDFWAFLRIRDIDGNIIALGNYGNYIAAGYQPIIFILESIGDDNNDLEGVISERVDNYTFKFKINNGSKFNDTNAVFQAQYIPTIDPEIV